MPHPLPSDEPLALTVGEYLTRRLVELGAHCVFGVPGDYSLGLADMLIDGGCRWVGCCNELNAGYAADAYARVSGIGVVCVTYGVGGFSALNAAAGAYAESVPLVVLCGAPAAADYTSRPGARPLPHHAVGRDLRAQQASYAPVTAGCALLLCAETAAAQIDEALATCLRASKPVLIEIPMDVAQARPAPTGGNGAGGAPSAGLAARLLEQPAARWSVGAPHNPHACAAAVAAIWAALRRAARPALLCGVEVHRRDCGPSACRLARLLQLPVATTRHGKAALHGCVCASVYAGAMSAEAVRNYVEGSDLLLILGAAWTDMDFVATAIPEGTALVSACDGSVTLRTPAGRVGGNGERGAEGRATVRDFGPVALAALIDGLCLAAVDALPQQEAAGGEGGAAELPPGGLAWEGSRCAALAAAAEQLPEPAAPSSKAPGGEDGEPSPGTSIGGVMAAFTAWVHGQPAPVTVLADAGDSLFAAADMRLRQRDAFIAQGWYCSIGYTVPAALGAAHAHARGVRAGGARAEGAPSAVRTLPAECGGRRVACLVGDGAFQMTAQELSSAVRDNLPITFFVLNNSGYGIERLIHEGPAHNDYNDVHAWDYAALAAAVGMREGAERGGLARRVATEAELAAALAALDLPGVRAGCNLVEVKLGRADFSAGLRRLGQAIKEANKLG